MQKKLLFIIFVSFLATFTGIAQQKDNFWKDVRYGGGLGLGFGEGYFNGSISPSAIYLFNHQFAAGLGLTYSYSKQKDFHESTYWGPSIIALFTPVDQLQLSAELEEFNIIRNYAEGATYNGQLLEDDNYWNTALFLGIGYTTQNITFGIRYDVLYNERKSIYANAWMPFVRVYL
ncbi:hypothetical protein SAMN05216480_10887 [Pustulibacterium marinum]|uniref:Alpha-ketoglutarate decarboxylase n=1 Tax=Pustulibacterium marinum TaxID=1224947 RepID=A0A1I7HBL9_9FLAO|nr:hypothetical protein [Pustulibacterium marinum]SFU58093.1 hypothetical protein SAMN05216480_10887 [Pustulibacterium marinum]